MRFISLTFFIIFAGFVEAQQASQFNCVDNAGNMIEWSFSPGTQDLQKFIFTTKTLWLANSIISNERSYKIYLFRPISAASGEMPLNSISNISFKLPTDLTITGFQSGGYYIPVYTYFPVKFSLLVKVDYLDEQKVSMDFNCTGV